MSDMSRARSASSPSAPQSRKAASLAHQMRWDTKSKTQTGSAISDSASMPVRDQTVAGGVGRSELADADGSGVTIVFFGRSYGSRTGKPGACRLQLPGIRLRFRQQFKLISAEYEAIGSKQIDAR